MGITIDGNGHAHRPRGSAGAGQFTSHVRSAPQVELAEEPAFNHDEWAARMAAIIDEGEPEQPEQPETVDLFDRATWGAAPF